MGSEQTKCSCGAPSTVEIIAIDKVKGWSLLDIFPDLENICKESGHRYWATAPFTTEKQTFKAYVCEECSIPIIRNLSKGSKFVCIANRSEKGYWRTGLP